MFEVLKNNKKLLVIHVIVVVVFIFTISVLLCFTISCFDDFKNEKKVNEESANTTINLPIDQESNLVGTTLSSCIRQDDHLQNLPEEIKHQGDLSKKVDYIIENNLYTIACDRLWHGDKSLLGDLTINEYVSGEKWWRMHNEDSRFEYDGVVGISVILDTGSEGYGEQLLFIINTSTDSVVGMNMGHVSELSNFINRVK